MTDEPRLQAEPREGVPDVIDTLPAFREYCSAVGVFAVGLWLRMRNVRLASDTVMTIGWCNYKRDGAGIGLLDPQAVGCGRC